MTLTANCKMTKPIVFVVVCLASIAFGVSLPSPKYEKVVEDILAKSSSLTFLGRVDSKRFFHVNASKTWYDSNRYCQELGMDILAVKNVDEWNFLRNNEEYPTRWLSYWTGVRDSGSRAQYKWADGQSLGDFFEWSDDSATYFTCVYMNIPGGKLREYGCNYGHTSVCQLVV